MAIDVRMPKLSDNMEEGIIVRWMKQPGDQVAKGEPLAEVETDKADVELEAAETGVLQEIRVAQGQSAAVGAVIAVLGDSAVAGDGHAPPPPAEVAAAAQSAAPPPAAKTASKPQQDVPHSPPAPAAPIRIAAPRPQPVPAAPPVDQAVRASPLAWRVAEEAGVDLSTVRGSGPGGRILRRDVETAAQAAKPASPAPPLQEAAAATEGGSPPAGPRIEPASRMRQTIAKRMAEAKRDIPHFYVGVEIDMSEAMRLRASIKQSGAMPGITITHLLVRGLAIALARHPRLNASWHDGAIELHDEVNIGIAVAVDDGLVVPVLHHAERLSLAAIVAGAAALTEKARQGRFGSEDLAGGTFSLSNVGMLDVDDLVAVINPPQSAILAVGATRERAVVRNGQLAVASTMRATLSCDHRVHNGIEGGRFLEELKHILENPVVLLLE
ncbi:MAG: dihydrolipoamide acetyltransferase family protein [Candidatus Binatia bacterium]